MEFFLLVLLVILLIVLLNFKSDTSSRLSNIESQLYEINRKLARPQVEQPKPTTEPIEEKPVQKPQITPPPPYWESGFKIVEETPSEPGMEIPAIAVAESVPTEKPFIRPAAIHETAAPTVQVKTPPLKPGFFERNPDLEKFIGENLVSKIGIGILVLAIAFFVKYAIDNNWIGPVGRVSVGLVCGGILVGLAHRLRTGYKAFSSVLVGGGLAVFYFTITLAHQRFHLFGDTPTIAFIIMIFITAFAVALSLLYDRQELAIIAMIGGFASPFMVSDGSGHYNSLFIYLIILNGGLLIMAYNKSWRILNLMAFIFTVLIYGGWLVTLNDGKVTPYQDGFIYATIFYLLFFAINIANNIKENSKFIASDFGILLANTSLYFAAGLYCIYNLHAEQYKGLFSACMGVFNLAATYILFRNKKVDANILYLLIGITLTFVSLSAPLQLQGHYITLFWASEAVVLIWLYQKSKIAIIQVSALLIFGAMLISLYMDWHNVYGNGAIVANIILNKGFITTVYAAIATFIVAFLVKKNTTPEVKSLIPFHVFGVAGLVLLFIAGAIEINYQFNRYYPDVQFSQLYTLLYTLSFVLLFLLIIKRVKSFTVSTDLQFILYCGCIIYYLISISNAFNIQEIILVEHKYSLHFIAHWIAAILTATIIYRAIMMLKDSNDKKYSDLFTWVACVLVVIFLSVELNLLLNSLFYNSTNTLEALHRIYIKTILPILWGLCSFAFMWLGMKYKYKPLRIVSLTLFSITLVKLFLFDISNIPIAGKIAAFFCLGVLLLVVSFMYQRLKKIIADDEDKSAV